MSETTALDLEVTKDIENEQSKPRKKRLYSKPYFEEELELKTDTTLQLTYGLIPKVMYSFFSLDVILFYIGERNFADQVNEQANMLLDEELNRVSKLLNKTKKQAVDNGINSMPKYTISKKRNFRKYTPLASKFVKIVNHVEEYNILMDALWLNNVVDSDERNNKLKKLKFNLFRFSRQMANLGERTMVVAKDKGIDADVTETLLASDYKQPESNEDDLIEAD
ncbi:TPA: hypothetical protein ACX6RM_002267 [Photobacterium damselae]